jgi:DNA-binding NarL/FixJ family response regulator
MEAETKKIRVLIVDDHPIIRHGLSQLINQETDMAICGEAEDGTDIIQIIEQTGPDVLLLDISLKSCNGIDLLPDIRARFPGLPVLMLTMHDETRYAERSLRAGAHGYIIKKDPPESVIQAVRQVLAGEIYLSRSMTSKMLKKVAAGDEARRTSPAEVLSAREREIFALIGEGKGTREVAELLNLSIKTVDAHRANIKKKLELKSAPELVQTAIKWTLTHGKL